MTRFSRGTSSRVHFTTFFGYLVDQLQQMLEEYGLTVVREEMVLSALTDDVPKLINRLFADDRLSRDEKNTINLLVLLKDEKADMTTMQYMKPLVQWHQLVNASDLVSIIEHQRIQVQYQPIVSLQTSTVYGYECLSRGVREDGTIVPPGALFQEAKQLNLLFNLDRVARENALRKASSHGITEHIFINFLPTAIYDPEFCLRTTMGVADEVGLPHNRIVFEIVESEQFDDIDHLKRILQYYRSRGVRTALDDVGSGYSSLNTLATLKPDIMKLDMKLIRGIHHDPLKQSIFDGLDRIARDNGILLLAEGVETAEELSFLRDRQVDLIQGYYFSRPLDTPNYTCSGSC